MMTPDAYGRLATIYAWMGIASFFAWGAVGGPFFGLLTFGALAAYLFCMLKS